MNTVGIIGFGNMGSCLAERIKSSKAKVWIFDKDRSKTVKLSGLNLAKDSVDLVKKSEAVVLAVKPQDFDSVLDEIKNKIKGKLVISIAAGISTGYIEEKLEDAGLVRVIRAMPNIAARIGKGITCLSKGNFASDADLEVAKELFGKVGETLTLGENRMDAATAVSGSGPGFCYDLMERQRIDVNKEYELEKFREGFKLLLAGAAVGIGFSPAYAMALAKATAEGSVELLKESKLSPQELKKQVASKGGTTEAGLEVLRKGESLENAVRAALEKAKELAHRKG